MGYQDYDQELHAQSFIKQEKNFKQIENALAYQKDVEYMKQLFPNALQIIQSAVEEECDKLEYSGSVMFDEYPDKAHLRMIVDNIMLLLTTSDEDAEGELTSTSLENTTSTKLPYCPDDAMLDCLDETDYDVQATAFDKNSSLEAQSWGPGWGSPGPWGPPPPPPGINRPCIGSLCPLANRRCGYGRYCPPIPWGDFDRYGNPNWKRHLVENMLTNEMLYRRSRYRNHYF